MLKNKKKLGKCHPHTIARGILFYMQKKQIQKRVYCIVITAVKYENINRRKKD